jgi:sulfoxide reductase heme-binding subunit YedZ
MRMPGPDAEPARRPAGTAPRAAPAWRARRWLLQAAAIAAGLLPAAKIVHDALTGGALGGLGANPIEAVLDRLGFWTLTFLTLSLVPTPAHELLGLAWPVRVRRAVGLVAFSYATLHLLFYVLVDQAGDPALLLVDVAKRKFMTVGFTAWLLLAPLAATSTSGWVRRLGYERWKRLHRLVYAAALLGIVHFVWRVKADLRRPKWFALAIGVLLAARLVGPLAKARRRAGTRAVA